MPRHGEAHAAPLPPDYDATDAEIRASVPELRRRASARSFREYRKIENWVKSDDFKQKAMLSLLEVQPLDSTTFEVPADGPEKLAAVWLKEGPPGEIRYPSQAFLRGYFKTDVVDAKTSEEKAKIFLLVLAIRYKEHLKIIEKAWRARGATPGQALAIALLSTNDYKRLPAALVASGDPALQALGTAHAAPARPSLFESWVRTQSRAGFEAVARKQAAKNPASDVRAVLFPAQKRDPITVSGRLDTDQCVLRTGNDPVALNELQSKFEELWDPAKPDSGKKNTIFLESPTLLWTTIDESTTDVGGATGSVRLKLKLQPGDPRFPAVDTSDWDCYLKKKALLWRLGQNLQVTGVDAKGKTSGWTHAEPLEITVDYGTPTSWALVSYMSAGDILSWFDQNIDGSKVVDDWEYPFWKNATSLAQQTRQDPSVTTANLAGLEKHLKGKYLHWQKEENTCFTEGEFDDKWKLVQQSTKEERDRLIGVDYRNHVALRAQQFRSDPGISTDQSIALAIYTSGEYGFMNKLYRGQQAKGGDVHIWLNAKAYRCIAHLGPSQNWKQAAQETAWPGGRNLPTLRRDESPYPENLIQKLKKKGNPVTGMKDAPIATREDRAKLNDDGDDRKSRFGFFDAFFSTTYKADGVSPFADDSNVAWKIDVSQAPLRCGVQVQSVSAYPGENEVLFRARTLYEIVKVDDKRTNLGTEANPNYRSSVTEKVFVWIKILPDGEQE